MTDPAVAPSVAAQTLMIGLDKVDIPQDSRPHSPEKQASLTESLKDGQDQEIGVVRNGDRFELVFGKGRVLGMRALKATQIRARVYETLTEAQKLDLTFSENEEREDANPIYQAYLLEKMVKASGLSQNKFAQSKGKTKGWISQYRSYLKFPELVLQVFNALNTSVRDLQALKRLKLPELQIQVAKEVKEGVTKPEDVGKRCAELMPVGKQRLGHGAQNPPDPYADLWSGVRDRIGASCKEAWQIGYVPFKNLQGEELTWMFALMNRNKVSPQRISAWLKQLAQGIDGAYLPDPASLSSSPTATGGGSMVRQTSGGDVQRRMQKLQAKAAEIAKRVQAQSHHPGDSRGPEALETPLDSGFRRNDGADLKKAAELWLPKTPQEVKEIEQSTLKVQLPQTRDEWAVVEALAGQGPGAVYEWAFGKDSYWARKAKLMTWQDLGVPDPISGCHKTIEGLRLGLEFQKGRAAPPQAPAPQSSLPASPPETAGNDGAEEPLDPKIAEMIARRKAKRMLP